MMSSYKCGNKLCWIISHNLYLNVRRGKLRWFAHAWFVVEGSQKIFCLSYLKGSRPIWMGLLMMLAEIGILQWGSEYQTYLWYSNGQKEI